MGAIALPTKPIFIRERLYRKLLEIAEKEGLRNIDGGLRWHYVLNELLEQAVALYELGQLRVRRGGVGSRNA